MIAQNVVISHLGWSGGGGGRCTDDGGNCGTTFSRRGAGLHSLTLMAQNGAFFLCVSVCVGGGGEVLVMAQYGVIFLQGEVLVMAQCGVIFLQGEVLVMAQ